MGRRSRLQEAQLPKPARRPTLQRTIDAYVSSLWVGL
jgi:hypothetical protein